MHIKAVHATLCWWSLSNKISHKFKMVLELLSPLRFPDQVQMHQMQNYGKVRKETAKHPAYLTWEELPYNLLIFAGSKNALKQDDKSGSQRGRAWSRILVLGVCWTDKCHKPIPDCLREIQAPSFWDLRKICVCVWKLLFLSVIH